MKKLHNHEVKVFSEIRFHMRAKNSIQMSRKLELEAGKLTRLQIESDSKENESKELL